jgi:hypothetical protein
MPLIDLEIRRRELNQVFKSEGVIGLLKEIYEDDDVIRIVGEYG